MIPFSFITEFEGTKFNDMPPWTLGSIVPRIAPAADKTKMKLPPLENVYEYSIHMIQLVSSV